MADDQGLSLEAFGHLLEGVLEQALGGTPPASKSCQRGGVLALLATAVAVGSACGGSIHHRKPVPEPEYVDLPTPVCSDVRDEDETNDCWHVSPTDGSKFVQVSASCGISASHAVQCWKDALATAPQGSFDVVTDYGRNACAARVEGGVTCWGQSPWPAVPSSPRFTALAMGGGGSGESDRDGVTACGLTENQDIVCWGDGTPHWSGRLNLSGPFTEVGLGGGLVVGLRPDGRLESYLGTENVDTKLGPFSMVSQHSEVSCQLHNNGSLECRGSWLYDHSAAPPRDLGPVRMIRTGGDHACALEVDGDVRCWGDARPPPALKFRYISQPDFWESYCGITLDGEAYCWGNPSRRPSLMTLPNPSLQSQETSPTPSRP